jgi:alpha-galactosidase
MQSHRFGSTTGYSSHLHNPFLSVVSSTTTETHGDAWGFSLVYTGSFQAEVEKGSQGLTRASIGFNTLQLSWSLEPGKSLASPECVSVYSDKGIGGMSRKLHRLYRNHLIKSKYATETRPVLLNSWEGRGFDVNESSVYQLAKETAELGVSLFVLDDGWFGNEHPRLSDNAGLGDWQPNKKRFPNGLEPLVESITELSVTNSSDNLKFGLWFEPEMVNPNSTLYETHPDWALHAGSYPRTETRNQLVLNVALPEVQDFIIDAVGSILRSSPISYVKWDNNRGIHESPSPGLDHQYMLGLYRVFENLTTQFPDVLWEGCASGGGRFDPGILQWFPQIWTSDDTDAVERVSIQFGTSLAYPPSAMGAHISNVPNGGSKRTTPFSFRAHVAMMGGSFGLELNPEDMDEDELAQLPGILELAARVNPIVIQGDLWRLTLPEDSQYPAALFIAEDGAEAALFVFQTRPTLNNKWPIVRLQGLDAGAKYTVNGTQSLSGSTLMNIGIQVRFENEYDSEVLLLERQ